MIKVMVKTSALRKEVVRETSCTPRQVFSDLGVNVSSSTPNLDGRFLSGADLDLSFENLGVSDGSTISLNCIVKAESAS